jgi:hypothetical protein
VVGVSSLAELQEIAAWHEAAADVSVNIPDIPFSPQFDPRTW